MILERISDATLINLIVNDPDVRPFVGPLEIGEIDLTDAAARPEHWFLLGEHGGFGLIWTAPNVHEVHTFILPSGRGKWAVEAAEAMIDFARKNGDTMLWTKIPPELKHVGAYARMMGMKTADMVIETFGLPYEVYKMELN